MAELPRAPSLALKPVQRAGEGQGHMLVVGSKTDALAGPQRLPQELQARLKPLLLVRFLHGCRCARVCLGSR